ncbi:uncharacterized protein ACRADG_003728 [Cochliomyia hominivorax]
MINKILLITFLSICYLAISLATNPSIVKTPLIQTCPIPTPQTLKCLRQWACQHAIRLDLRCLLNLNGTPLLGGILGGTGGLLGGVGGGAGNPVNAGTGILGGLLGR